jgi:chemotaxis family two-component system response regulator Rcp1
LEEIKKNIKVLLVENKNSGLLLEDILTKSSLRPTIEITVFNDEKELLKYLEESKSDISLFEGRKILIIFNLVLPLENVPNTVEIIKEDLKLKYIPVFVITPKITDEEILDLYNRHVNTYLLKPDDLKGLIELMDLFKTYWYGKIELP